MSEPKFKAGQKVYYVTYCTYSGKPVVGEAVIGDAFQLPNKRYTYDLKHKDGDRITCVYVEEDGANLHETYKEAVADAIKKLEKYITGLNKYLEELGKSYATACAAKEEK